MLEFWSRSPSASMRHEFHFIFFGEPMLRNAVLQFLEYYRGERNHRGLANRILAPGEEVGRTSGEIRCRERLGGLLRYYRRKAA